jgi:glycerate-2-kinase
LGDPLDVIASGPTTADHSTPGQAMAILERFGARDASPQAWAYLQAAAARQQARPPTQAAAAPICGLQTTIIGNNATAVAAGADRSRALGYTTEDAAGVALEGPAEQVAAELLGQFRQRLTQDASPVPRCLISGGEPTVHLAPAGRRGRGGRNQQLVLEAMRLLLLQPPGRPLVLLSGGTDGEDGPTDAAGAWIDSHCLEGGDPGLLAQVEDALARNDAYPLFQRLGRLIQTGPTHTNVCDLRIIVSR